ncbi:class I SAM-dependent methyltransferase [Pseudonocardia alaniniphila]|uniref:Class I SAM-dependent methyltransferase n=1 Tax=Pseudonocardia alaniniphila TaxID=75291 RepID=A0ABS9T9N3_9PSEU|nr:class I SAM-dependent methyltransferase [Pseudonocardia alaniniphila]MCH6165240.1 class I SAM-dependent methyltransferase [Pseudonocardia alaniniphila]
MNRVETAVVNSPPRRWLQRYEARLLHRLGGPVTAGRVLELGCGRGFGTRLILDRFGAREVDALDLDPRMVTRARSRLAPLGNRARVVRGSATDLRAAFDPGGSGRGGESGGYDAVFDFAIVHHVPEWRHAVAEVVRVLKPGGRFYFDEVTAAALATRGYRWLFDHPTEDRFTGEEFVAELQRQGLQVRGWRTYLRGHYLLGVAERPRGDGKSR